MERASHEGEPPPEVCHRVGDAAGVQTKKVNCRNSKCRSLAVICIAPGARPPRARRRLRCVVDGDVLCMSCAVHVLLCPGCVCVTVSVLCRAYRTASVATRDPAQPRVCCPRCGPLRTSVVCVVTMIRVWDILQCGILRIRVVALAAVHFRPRGVIPPPPPLRGSREPPSENAKRCREHDTTRVRRAVTGSGTALYSPASKGWSHCVASPTEAQGLL